MNDSSFIPQSLQELLNSRFSSDFEWDLVPVPAHGDKMFRLRTIEEAIEEFDSESDGGLESKELVRYLIQIKPKRTYGEKREARDAQDTQDTKDARSPKGTRVGQDHVYLSSGALNIEFLIENAKILLASGDYPLARNIFNRIAQSGQSGLKTSEALLSIAKCFELEKDLESARVKYEESITYFPTLETYQRLATLLIHQGKSLQAAETLERALHLKEIQVKTRYELHKAIGNSWMKAGVMANAEKNYKKALEIDPMADEIQANLGALYLHGEKISEARRRFQDVLAANPQNDKALAGLGSCFLAVGDKRAAHDHFAKALQINVHNAQAIFHLVKCAYELKSFATAAQILEEYVQVAPINVNLLYSLAGLQFHLGRMTCSRSTCEKILELCTNHTGAQELLGMMP